MDSPQVGVSTPGRADRFVLTRRHSTWLISAAIMGATIGAFLPSLRVLRTPEFVQHYEDLLCKGETVKLEMVKDETVRFGKPRPVASLIHLGLLTTCRDHALPYKAMHLAFFSLTGIALFLAISGWDSRSVAFLTAALFLLFPPRLNPDSLVHVMTLDRYVAMDLLLASYLAWRRAGASSAFMWTALSTVLFLLALLSKESVLLLPLVFPLLTRYLEQQQRGSLRQHMVRMAPLLAVMLIWGVARLAMAKTVRYGLSEAQFSLESTHLLNTLRDSGRLMFDIPRRLPGVWISWASWAAVVLLQISHRNWSIRVVGACWLLLALAPHLHLREQGQNYVYFALPWVCYSIVRGVDMLMVARVKTVAARWCVWGLVLGSLAVYAHVRTRAVAAPWAALGDIRKWVQVHAPCVRPSLQVGLLRASRDVVRGKGSSVLRCGTGIDPNQIDIGTWDGSQSPPGAIVGESLGMKWWAQLRCQE